MAFVDIGALATDRAAALTPGNTLIGLANPASADSTFLTVEIWAASTGSGVKVGTFSGSGTSYTSRDYETLGTIASGSKQTITGLSIDALSGDFIGYFATGGNLEADTTGGSGIYAAGGDQFGTGAQTYGLSADIEMSLYAYSSVIDQLSFRFRDDNGSETTATWLAAENVDITRPLDTNTRIRLLLDTVVDTPSQAYQLEHRINAGTWYKTLVGVQTPIPAFVNAGTLGVAGTSDTVSTCGAPASLADGNILILQAYSSDAADVISAHADWTVIFQNASSTGRLAAWYFRYSGVSPTNYTVSRTGAGEAFVTGCAQYSNIITTGDPIRTSGADGAGTDASIELATMTPTAGDLMLLIAGASDDNDVSDLAGYAFAFDPGAGNNYETATGAPDGMITQAYKISAGGATGEITLTQSGSDPWASKQIALIPAPYNNDVYIALSDNIAASAATATTAQLTAPGGHSFTAGAISDDTNPITTDIGSSYYCEWEWCVIWVAPVVDTDTIEFRVTIAGTPLDTYTEVPMVTVGVAFSTYEESCTDGLTLGDTTSHILVLYLVNTDGIVLGDTVTTSAILFNTLIDGLILGDTATTLANLQEALTDGLNLGDTPVIFMVWEGVLTDGLLLGDALSHDYITNPELTDGITLGDTPLTQIVFDCTLTDGTVLGDTTLNNAILQELITDGLLLGDTITENIVIYLSLTDGIKLSDQPTVYEFTLTVSLYSQGMTFQTRAYTLTINLNNQTLEMRTT